MSNKRVDYEKINSVRELIESFDIDTYEKQVDELNKRIINLESGMPEYAGINNMIQSRTLTEEERKKIIENLEKRKEKVERLSDELTSVILELNRGLDDIENLAKKAVLLDKLDSYLPDSIKEKETFKNYHNMERKLYRKSRRKVQDETKKISKDMYKLLKDNSKLRVGDLTSLGDAISQSKYNMEELFYKADLESYHKYRAALPAFDDGYERQHTSDLSSLGIDSNSLDYAIKSMKSEEFDEHCLTWDGIDSFHKLKNIEILQKKDYRLKVEPIKIEELKEKYIEIVQLSKETWYIEDLLLIFEETVIKDSEMYKGLKDLVEEQHEKLTKLNKEADKLYDKYGLQNKITLVGKLEELYSQIQRLKLQIKQNEEMKNYNQVDLIREEYFGLRREMIGILIDNPELNRPEYGINIENIIKKEKELLEPEIKKEVQREEPSYIKNDEEEMFIERTAPQTPTIEEPAIEKSRSAEEIPTHIQTKEEEMFIDKTYENENDSLIKNIELDSTLQAQRTMHYQNYMIEKIKQSELGKISFSNYLKRVAPHLTSLIEIEKKRERMANTIYREYIKYVASLENKKSAMRFEEYAQRIYDVDNIEIPIEHEEEYKGMRV